MVVTLLTFQFCIFGLGRLDDLSCTCKGHCVDKLLADRALKAQFQKFQEKVKGMSTQDRSKFFFGIVRQMSVQQDGSLGKIGNYKLLGQDLCQQGFTMLTGMSKSFINRLVTAVQGGAFEAPMDGRSCRASGERNVDAFFAFLYEFVAELLAEGQLAVLCSKSWVLKRQMTMMTWPSSTTMMIHLRWQ